MSAIRRSQCLDMLCLSPALPGLGYANNHGSSISLSPSPPQSPPSQDPLTSPRFLYTSTNPAAFGGAPNVREDLPLPTSPPYTCFVGGLAFESTDADLSEFFADLNPTSVRLVKDVQGKAKGFGYVEFPSVDGLKAALDRSGASLGGRTLRTSVAEAREYLSVPAGGLEGGRAGLGGRRWWLPCLAVACLRCLCHFKQS